MNVTTLPKADRFKPDLEAAGKSLDQPEAPPAPPAAMAHRPTAEEAKALSDDVQLQANLLALDQRIEAALNFMRLCTIQRDQQDFISGDGAEFRALMTSGDRLVGGKGFVSSGFGDPVHVVMALEVRLAVARLLAAANPPPPVETPAGDPSPVVGDPDKPATEPTKRDGFINDYD